MARAIPSTGPRRRDARHQAVARDYGRDHDLAMALWKPNGTKHAPGVVRQVDKLTAAQMESWCRDFYNWAITTPRASCCSTSRLEESRHLGEARTSTPSGPAAPLRPSSTAHLRPRRRAGLIEKGSPAATTSRASRTAPSRAPSTRTRAGSSHSASSSTSAAWRRSAISGSTNRNWGLAPFS